MESKICQSCGMPVRTAEESGTDRDGSRNQDYCVHCFKNGDFTSDLTLDGMIALNVQHLDLYSHDAEVKVTEKQAVEQLKQYLPTLKRWEKKLFLASYFSPVAKLFVEFTQNTCAGKKVAFIPTASIPEKVTFFVDGDRKALGKLGLIIDELEVSNASQKEIEDKITGADYIFVAGGNTFFLLQELKRSGADRLIVEHIGKGKPYVSTSAGSIIVSKDIEYVKYMDSPATAPDLNGNFSGLGIVDFYTVPHCINFPFKKAAEKIISEYGNRLDLRPVHNKQAIAVKGSQIETVEIKSKK
jgi:dipeptidase E